MYDKWQLFGNSRSRSAFLNHSASNMDIDCQTGGNMAGRHRKPNRSTKPFSLLIRSFSATPRFFKISEEQRA